MWSYLPVYFVVHKKCQFIFYYNSQIYWWIFALYVPVETGMNILLNRYKMYNFTLAVSSIVAILPAV